MDAQSTYWYVPVAIGGALLAIVPTVRTDPAMSAGYAVGFALGVGLLIYATRRAVARVLARYGQWCPGVMTPRAYALPVLLSYVYVGWNINVLFPVPPGQFAPDLAFAALIYGAFLSLLVALGKMVFRRASPDLSASSG
jgi:hypothetical protein